MTAAEALGAAHLSGWRVRKMLLQVPQEPIITGDGVTSPPPLAVPPLQPNDPKLVRKFRQSRPQNSRSTSRHRARTRNVSQDIPGS
jgi:hypothetical protein